MSRNPLTKHIVNEKLGMPLAISGHLKISIGKAPSFEGLPGG